MTAPLLSPYSSPALALRNRVCMAPMTRGRADNPGHVPNDLMAEYYAQRASAGLIVSEGTHVSPRANGWNNVPGLYTPEQVAGWRKATDAVHARGGTIFCQLWHQGRMSHPDLLGGELPVAPSAVAGQGVAAYIDGYVTSPIPHAMSADEVHRAVEEFAHAARCAGEAGFDGVEIHGANGYLIHQFLSDESNLRTDEYGGSPENRARFLFEVLDAVTQALPSRQVGLRLSPSMNNMQGLTITAGSNEAFDLVVPRLGGYGLAYLHLLQPMQPVDRVKEAYPDVARHYRPLYDGTLIINASYDFDKGNQVLVDGWADLVSFGTLYISNPDLVERFAGGEPLAEGDKETFYTPGARGYTDYPPAR